MRDKSFPIFVVLIVIMTAIILMIPSCTKPCIRGHYADVYVPAHDEGYFIQVGDIPIWMPNDVPAHIEKDRFICDEHQR